MQRRMLVSIALSLLLPACGGISILPDAATNEVVDGMSMPDASSLSKIADASVAALDAASPVSVTDAATPGVPRVEYFGRFDVSDPAGPRFTWSNSAIRAEFSGTSVSVKLEETANTEASGNIYFVSIVDDGTPQRFATRVGTSTYSLASGLAPGAHRVLLSRDTEGNYGLTQFLGFTFDDAGQLLPPVAASSLRLEVIGDSLTCGWGNLGTDPCSNVEYESSHASYTQQTADLLGAAPATVICQSGIPLVGMSANPTFNAPTYYSTTLTPIAIPSLNNSSWTFPTDPASQPDVVVINLGTNDLYNPSGFPPSFVSTYVTFVQSIRAHYPRALIVAGGHTGTIATNVQAAVNQLQAAGDKNVRYFLFPNMQPADGVGCNGHPTEKTDTTEAMQLAAFIKQEL